VIPKALHANMFLVQRAKETMERDVLVLPGATSFDALLAQPDNEGRMRHIVVAEDNRIVGVLRVNTALRQASAGAASPIALRDIASRDFTIAREDDIVFDVIQRIWRRNAVMALVVSGRRVPRPTDVVGVITKEHVADSVANSVKIYPG
jgi:CIC family chloride channel protein